MVAHAERSVNHNQMKENGVVTHGAEGIATRLATVHDAAAIAGHRAQMFYEMGSLTDDLMEPLALLSTDYMERTITADEYVGWLAYELHEPLHLIAGAGVLIRQIPPFPTVDAAGNRGLALGKQGLVLNVYVERAFRRRGIATVLMQEILAWSSRERIDRLVLHASEAGKPLYKGLGFIMTNEMRYAPPVLHTS